MAANKVNEFFLKNGFKLLVKEDHRSPIAAFQLVYKVGSSYEHNGLTGISHVLEHMMFRGSKHYSAKKFLTLISEGGSHQNASTGHDYTEYHHILNTAKLEECFKIEADRMVNLFLNKKDFLKEMRVVIEERHLRMDDPQQKTLERFMAAAFLSNPYHHPVIGWQDDLQYMTINDVMDWYHTWYAPNNSIGIVVGDVKPKKVYQLAQKYFGRLNPSILPIIKPQREVSPLGMRTVQVITKTKLPWLVLGYNTPVLKTANERWKPYALVVLGEILAGGNSARLQQTIVRGKEIAADIGYYYTPFNRLDSVMYFYATPALGHKVEELRESVLNEIKHLQDNLLHTHELNRVKVQTIAKQVYSEDSILYQAQEMGALEAVGLSWRELHRAYHAIESITSKQVREVAREFLTNDRLILADTTPVIIKEGAS